MEAVEVWMDEGHAGGGEGGLREGHQRVFAGRSVLCQRPHITGAAERSRVRDRLPRKRVLPSSSLCSAHPPISHFLSY